MNPIAAYFFILSALIIGIVIGDFNAKKEK